MKQQHHWYHWLWLWSLVYFSLGFVNILFAWLGLISISLYSLMLTSEVIALAAMLWFKPRSWCVFCPMGTLTQTICRLKS